MSAHMQNITIVICSDLDIHIQLWSGKNLLLSIAALSELHEKTVYCLTLHVQLTAIWNVMHAVLLMKGCKHEFWNMPCGYLRSEKWLGLTCEAVQLVARILCMTSITWSTQAGACKLNVSFPLAKLIQSMYLWPPCSLAVHECMCSKKWVGSDTLESDLPHTTLRGEKSQV